MAALALAPLSVPAADLAILQNGFEIRHEGREVIGATTRLYLSQDRAGGFVDVPTANVVRYEQDDSPQPASSEKITQSTAPKPIDVNAAVEAASRTHFIDPDLIASVIHAESRFNPRAVSPKGAQGLMQLMPGTASKLGVTDAFDPNANVDGGTRYLRELLLKYDDDLIKALAAYNAGPHRVDQYRGVPPYRETRQYVANIIRDFNRKKLAQTQAKSTSPRSSVPSTKAVSKIGKRQANTTVAKKRTKSTGSATGASQ